MSVELMVRKPISKLHQFTGPICKSHSLTSKSHICFDLIFRCCSPRASFHTHRQKLSNLKMGYVQEASENRMKKKVEEAIRSKMKQKALKECDQYTAKYAQCASGRTFSVIWLCRKQAKELNQCLHQFTNDAVLEEMKREYMLQQGGKGSVEA